MCRDGNYELNIGRGAGVHGGVGTNPAPCDISPVWPTALTPLGERGNHKTPTVLVILKCPGFIFSQQLRIQVLGEK